MIWAAIKSAMERNDIHSIAELARRTGIGSSTLAHTRRTNPKSFILYEILQIDKVLNFTDAEWGMIRQ